MNRRTDDRPHTTSDAPRRLRPIVGCGLVVAALSVSLTPAQGQESLPLISGVVDPAHFGLSGPGDIQRGRVSIVYDPEGVRLTVQNVRDDPTRPRITYPEPPPTPEPVHPRDAIPRQTALWVWETRRILDSAEERAHFLDFVRDQQFTRVFLLIPPAKGTTYDAGFIPFSSEELGPLLAELRERGALTYALDGDPAYALPENHDGVVRTVERLAAHNRSVPESQRFHGVRYDIEPYLVPGFQGTRRAELLNGYVTVIDRASRTARASDLAFAVDIPFWFDSPDEETGEFLVAELDGRRAPVLEHIMTAVDDLAIMDYRTSALGPNGAIAQAYNEIELAARFGVEVFVGVETVRLNDEDLHTFFGMPAEGLPPHARARWVVLTAGRLDGPARLWVVDSAEALESLEAEVGGAVIVRHWPAGRPTRVAGDVQSFHSLGIERMRSVTAEIVLHLAGRPTFAGLAFHDYPGMRALVEGR
jgi:hypothetical protein